MQKINLPALQKQFRDVLKLGNVKARPVIKLINVNDRFTRDERIEVYQYAYLSRLVESMQEDFPLVQETLGEKHFVALVEKYLEEHPSRYWTLAELGSKFPEYLGGAKAKKFLLSRKQTANLKGEFLRDLAQVELERIIAFLLQAPPAFDFGGLRTLEPEVLLAGQLRLNPSLKVVMSRWPVANEVIDKKTRKLIAKPSTPIMTYAIFRSGSGVQTYKVPDEFTAVFTALHKKMSVGKVLETVLKKKIEAQAVFNAFAEWAALGLITSFDKKN